MQSISILLQTIAVAAVLGAIVETFVPGLITEKLKSDLTALTIATLGILFSFLLLMWLLKLRIREGFEEQAVVEKWNQMVSENKVKEICALYTDIYDKMLLVEKGAPPEQTKSDAQAREAVEKQFAPFLTHGPISCKMIQDLEDAEGSIDTMYPLVLKVPDELLIQSYETANACLTLLIQSYMKVKDAEKRREEGFEDLCTDAEAEERRQYLKATQPSEASKTCRLPEEIPLKTKETAIQEKLDEIKKTVAAYRLKNSDKTKSSIEKILQDSQYYKAELEKKKQEAESMSNQYQFK